MGNDTYIRLIFLDSVDIKSIKFLSLNMKITSYILNIINNNKNNIINKDYTQYNKYNSF